MLTLLWSVSAIALVVAGLLLMLGMKEHAGKLVGVTLMAFALGTLLGPCLGSLRESLPRTAGVDGLALLALGGLSVFGYILWQRRGITEERPLPRDRALPPPPRFTDEER